MNNLVPEKRVDKNGRLVTKHVKGSSSSSTSINDAPAPSLNNVLGNKLADKLNTRYESPHGSGRLSPLEALQKARRMRDSTAKVILDRMEEVDDEGDYKMDEEGTFKDIIFSAIQHGADNDMLENISFFYDDYIYQGFDLEDEGAYKAIIGDINGLSKYPQLQQEDNYYRADEDTRNAAKLLLSLSYDAEKEGDGAYKVGVDEYGDHCNYLTNPRFVQLAIDNSDTEEKRGAFRDIVYDKGCNPDAVEEVLNTTIPMRDGVL